MEKRQLDLCRYRLDKAKDDFRVSKSNLENKDFSQSIIVLVEKARCAR